MLTEDLFARNDVFPSWIVNALDRFLSLNASNAQVVKVDDTHIEVPAGTDEDAAVMAVGGLWRWVEATIGPIAHPGGAQGIYPVFATAKANDIVASPQPYTDNTDYSWTLQIKAPGATPAIVAGTVDVYRHIANVLWDGARIVDVEQLVPAPTGAGPKPGDLIPSGAASRDGCVLCDGRAIPRTGMFARLFAAVGTVYGGGDGVSTFNVPDYRDTVIIGASGTRALGARGGENTHVLTNGEMPTHAHGGTTGNDSPDHVHYTSGTTSGQSVDHTHGMDNPPVNPGGAGWGTVFISGVNGSPSYAAPFNNNYAGGSEGATHGTSTDHTHTWGNWSGGANVRHAHSISPDGGGGAHNNMQQWATGNVFMKL